MSALQPLYDVKERLEAAAIAGTGLLGEDFRLQRAAESLRSLASANPVFGKISAGLDKLSAASEEERPMLLLDILSLVDAVAYTQGQSGIDGELEPLSPQGGTYIQISYNQLHPLLAALTGKGGGRVEVVRTAWEAHPEFFEDYRVLPAVIAGLGDNYPEMPALCVQILEKMGPAVIPFLKKDFDLKGGYSMVRRVEVIDAIAGVEEEEWFLSMLPKANKRVRAPLIYTLRFHEGNLPKLKEYCQKETNECLEKAIQAVVCLRSPEAAAYARELAKQHPRALFEALGKSDNPLHGDLVAELLGAQFDKLFKKEAPNWDNRLWNGTLDLLPAALGKDSSEMLGLYRELAAWYAGHFDRWKSSGPQYQNRRKIPLLDPFLGRDGKWPLPAGLLAASIWRNPSGALQALAEELVEQYGWAYYAPLVLSVGLREGPGAVWERFAPQLAPDVLTRNQRLGILFGLGLLTGREKGKRTLDSRWTATLMTTPLVPLGGDVPLWRASGYKNQSWVYTAGPLEIALCALDDGDDVCVRAFKANLPGIEQQPGVSVDYLLEALRYRGLWDWRGVIPAVLTAAKERISPLDLERWYREYVGGHMTNGEKIRELEWVREEVRAKRFRTFVTWSEERIQQVIDGLR